METLLMCTIFGVFIWSSFLLGLHYGSKVKKDEKIEIPNPTKIVTKHIEEKKYKEQTGKEQEIEEINLYNIDNYDGTGLGQKDFPS